LINFICEFSLKTKAREETAHKIDGIELFSKQFQGY